MRFIDYYQVMGLADTATADEVKKAYRKLARKYHPDVSKEKDAEEKFKALGEAYEVLKDPAKRAEYDELRRHGARAAEEFTPPPGWDRMRPGHAEGGSGKAQNFSDFFEAIFGRGQGAERARHPAAGNDIHHRLQISLEEVQQLRHHKPSCDDDMPPGRFLIPPCVGRDRFGRHGIEPRSLVIEFHIPLHHVGR